MSRTARLIALLVGVMALATTGAAGAWPVWTSYHHDGTRAGVADSSPRLDPAHASWTSPGLSGEIYGQPLAFNGRVFVGTEADVVYALDLTTGRVLWHTTVARPTPAAALPCGDISPTVGITSTLAIDPVLNRVFAVAEDDTNGVIRHYLVALNGSTGAVVFKMLVDPALMISNGAQNSLQRASLALAGGRVVIGFGGNDGDCGDYRGWVVSAPESGSGGIDAFAVQTDTSGGAVWAGGAAPAVNSSGDIYVSTGNTFNSSTCDNGNSVFELSPTMAVLHVWPDPNCITDNNNDADLGSAGPILLGGGLLFQPSGKSSAAATLNATTLAPLYTHSTGCYGFGGSAAVGDTVYLACDSGTQAWSINPSTGVWTVLWTSSTGANGPPIYASGLVWVVDTGSATLYSLNPANGNQVQAVGLPGVEHFTSPSAAGGRVLVSVVNSSGVGAVQAFAGPEAPVIATVGPHQNVYMRTVGQTGFASLGGAGYSSPAVVYWSGRPYFFVIGSSREIYVRDQSLSWRPLASGQCLTEGAAVSGNTLVAACEGTNHQLYYGETTMPASGLPSVSGWTSLGGYVSAGVAVTVVNGAPDFVVTGATQSGHDIYTRTLSSGWAALGYECTSQPALADGPFAAYFACIAADRALYWSYNFHAPYYAGGTATGTPGLAAAPDGTVWAFVLGPGNQIYQRPLGVVGPTSWASIGGSAAYGVGGVETS